MVPSNVAVSRNLSVPVAIFRFVGRFGRRKPQRDKDHNDHRLQ
ncbi:hypothetical protein NY08_661 [Rhodococcus sp. B7740]|nr:hypothetical protein NY08_661 [Rhodococcus sp. B7740]